MAAYRDRWNIDGPTVVRRHHEATSIEQLGHQRRAQAAIDRAVAICRTRPAGPIWNDPSTSARIENGVQPLTSRRKQAKDLAQWEACTRGWATDTARDLRKRSRQPHTGLNAL